MDSLPSELVVYILECLDHDDLWSAAAVSRLFYASAWSAGLYIHRDVGWRDTPSRTILNDIVQHAQKKGLRLSLSIDLLDVRLGNTLYHAHSSSTAPRILGSVEVALPLLVYLSVSVAEILLPSLSAVLCHPAPHIAWFNLSIGHIDYSAPFYKVPVDLFMGSAPKLCRLELKDVTLGSDPVPVLSLVHSVSLDYTENFPHIDYTRHFACLRTLDLRYSGINPDAPLLPLFMLNGVRLRRLTVEDYEPYTLMPTVMLSTDIGAIASVAHTGSAINWGDPLWHRTGGGPLSVRLTRHVLQDADISVLVVPEHRCWRRMYTTYWNHTDAFPVRDLPGLGDRLAYLRMENRIIASLLECAGLTLSALRELRIDFEHIGLYSRTTYTKMVWPPDWLYQADGDYSFHDDDDRSGPVFASPSYSHIGCSALQQLTLVSLDTEIVLASEEIAFLGRAFAQCERCAHDRAALVLSGIELQTPIAQTLLEQTFSGILHAPADRNSLSERDAGFWDDI